MQKEMVRLSEFCGVLMHPTNLTIKVVKGARKVEIYDDFDYGWDYPNRSETYSITDGYELEKGKTYEYTEYAISFDPKRVDFKEYKINYNKVIDKSKIKVDKNGFIKIKSFGKWFGIGNQWVS